MPTPLFLILRETLLFVMISLVKEHSKDTNSPPFTWDLSAFLPNDNGRVNSKKAFS